jgi:hypothetical protein
MPVIRISHEPNRPDLALVAGTGQLVAHLSHLVLTGDTTVFPLACTGGATGPTILGEVQPCIQAAAFKRPGRAT